MNCFKTVFIAVFFSGSALLSQSIQPTNPMVFLWAEDKERATGEIWRPLGSGFLVGSYGAVLTARHVVDNRRTGERIVVSISSKSQFPIRIDETDIVCAATSQDICSVRIPKDAIPQSVTSEYELLCKLPEQGSQLRALGFFGGGDRFAGVNQPKGEVIGEITRGRLIPTDIDLVPTMSGGPVFDANNRVIAVVKGADKVSVNLTFVTSLLGASSLLKNIGVDCPETAQPVCDPEKLTLEEYMKCNP